MTERPETVECGSNILSGADAEAIGRAVRVVLEQKPCRRVPPEYLVEDVSAATTKIVLGRHERAPEPRSPAGTRRRAPSPCERRVTAAVMDPAPASIQAPETIELSVIIQTRNRVGILMETLARLIEQETDVRFEVVVVDDGSTDATVASARSLAECAPVPITVL